MLYSILSCAGLTYPFAPSEFKLFIESITKNFVLVIVDNKLDPDFKSILDNIHIIGSDEYLMEWSAFQTGLDYTNRSFNITNSDSFVFATSAFQNKPNGYLNNIQKEIKLNLNKSNIVIGHFDSFMEEYSILQNKQSEWMRTSCFFLSHNIVNMINFQINNINEKNAFKFWFTDDKLNSDKCSQNFITLITNWVDNHGNYLNASTDIKKKKLLSIVNEKLLTMYIVESNPVIIKV